MNLIFLYVYFDSIFKIRSERGKKEKKKKGKPQIVVTSKNLQSKVPHNALNYLSVNSNMGSSTW